MPDLQRADPRQGISRRSCMLMRRILLEVGRGLRTRVRQLGSCLHPPGAADQADSNTACANAFLRWHRVHESNTNLCGCYVNLRTYASSGFCPRHHSKVPTCPRLPGLPNCSFSGQLRDTRRALALDRRSQNAHLRCRHLQPAKGGGAGCTLALLKDRIVERLL